MAEGEDADPDGTIDYGMDLLRTRRCGKSVGDLTAAAQDASAENHWTGDGG
jgi:hypothetical protein